MGTCTGEGERGKNHLRLNWSFRMSTSISDPFPKFVKVGKMLSARYPAGHVPHYTSYILQTGSSSLFIKGRM
jgi:hypothetical protein